MPREKRNSRNPKNKYQTLDRYYVTHEWAKGTLKRTLDPDEVAFRLENDLPVDDLYDNITYFDKYESDENV